MGEIAMATVQSKPAEVDRQLVSKPLTFFRTENQVREVKDDQELLALGQSLLVRQLQPVIARTNGTLVAGHRRLRAAILVGKPTLDVIITDENLSDSQIRLIQLAENVHRAGLTANELCDALEEMLRLNPEWNAKTLAQNVHLDPSSITRYLSRSKCVAAVREAFAAGKIGVGDMYAISKLDESSQPELLALKLSGASRDVIEQAGRKSRKGNKPSVKVTRTRLPLPSGVCIVVSGQALSLDGLIESLGQAQTAAKRALAQDQDIKSFQAVMTARSKKRSEIAT
jgi:ParB family transcriptional regulator, chromosome partitioning protein